MDTYVFSRTASIRKYVETLENNSFGLTQENLKEQINF